MPKKIQIEKLWFDWLRRDVTKRFEAAGGRYTRDGRAMMVGGAGNKPNSLAVAMSIIAHLPKKPTPEWMQLVGLGAHLESAGLYDDAMRGQKVLNGAKRAHLQTHGTPESRRQIYDDISADIAQRIRKNPSLSLTAARRRAAKLFGVSVRSIITHTQK